MLKKIKDRIRNSKDKLKVIGYVISADAIAIFNDSYGGHEIYTATQKQIDRYYENDNSKVIRIPTEYKL